MDDTITVAMKKRARSRESLTRSRESLNSLGRSRESLGRSRESLKEYRRSRRDYSSPAVEREYDEPMTREEEIALLKKKKFWDFSKRDKYLEKERRRSRSRSRSREDLSRDSRREVIPKASADEFKREESTRVRMEPAMTKGEDQNEDDRRQSKAEREEETALMKKKRFWEVKKRDKHPDEEDEGEVRRREEQMRQKREEEEERQKRRRRMEEDDRRAREKFEEAQLEMRWEEGTDEEVQGAGRSGVKRTDSIATSAATKSTRGFEPDLSDEESNAPKQPKSILRNSRSELRQSRERMAWFPVRSPSSSQLRRSKSRDSIGQSRERISFFAPLMPRSGSRSTLTRSKSRDSIGREPRLPFMTPLALSQAKRRRSQGELAMSGLSASRESLGRGRERVPPFPSFGKRRGSRGELRMSRESLHQMEEFRQRDRQDPRPAKSRGEPADEERERRRKGEHRKVDEVQQASDHRQSKKTRPEKREEAATKNGYGNLDSPPFSRPSPSTPSTISIGRAAAPLPPTPDEIGAGRARNHVYEDPKDLAGNTTSSEEESVKRGNTRRQILSSAASRELAASLAARENDREEDIAVLTPSGSRTSKRIPWASSREVRTIDGDLDGHGSGKRGVTTTKHVRDGKTLFETKL